MDLPADLPAHYIVGMNVSANITLLKARLQSFNPDRQVLPRTLAFYSAAIASADDECMTLAAGIGAKFGVERRQFYEVVLQSYLFLGFPRMLLAAERLDKDLPVDRRPTSRAAGSPSEDQEWYDRGLRLYHRVYDSHAARLRDKVESMAPEIFRWMIAEGYGKVLSRPGLDIVDRELSIVAFLTMENRPKQLYSHLLGAVNVGASKDLISLVIDDIGEAAGEGYRTAVQLVDALGDL